MNDVRKFYQKIAFFLKIPYFNIIIEWNLRKDNLPY